MINYFKVITSSENLLENCGNLNSTIFNGGNITFMQEKRNAIRRTDRLIAELDKKMIENGTFGKSKVMNILFLLVFS